jgi:hypothetical protein
MIESTKNADYATISIGVDRDMSGAPLVKADGKLLGTVQQMKDMIVRFEDESLCTRIISIVRNAKRRGVL